MFKVVPVIVFKLVSFHGIQIKPTNCNQKDMCLSLYVYVYPWFLPSFLPFSFLLLPSRSSSLLVSYSPFLKKISLKNLSCLFCSITTI